MKQYFNEKNQVVNVQNLLAEIESDTEKEVTETEVEGLLEQYHGEALALDFKNYAMTSEELSFAAPNVASLAGMGPGIWARIREFVCSVNQ